MHHEYELEDMKAFIKRLIGKKLGIDESTIDEGTAFFTLGVTSLISTEILNALNQRFESLSCTLLFEYPNIKSLSSFLMTQKPKSGIRLNIRKKRETADEASRLLAGGTQKSPRVSTLHESCTRLNHVKEKDENRCGYKIAVVGLSVRVPKACDQFQFWQNLISGRECVEEIPKDRWDYKRFFSEDREKRNTLYGKWGGFIDDVDKFDPLFFRISHRDAELMDPQQKLLLQCSWEAMEDAGYGKVTDAKTRNIGVYVGVTWNEFSLYTNEERYLKDDYGGAGSLYWGIPNRVSFFLNATGPSVAVDTACSSSLVALHMACQALLSHDCEMAIVGGVNLNLHPSKYIYLSQSQFLSTDGKCRSFGEGGDGYVPGEGVGVVLLKPFSKAVEDGDQIYGIIRGTATNHGGRVTGYTVPNPEAHKEVIRTAIQRACVHPRDLSYIECHGTGTELGDPIEVKGLSLAFEDSTEEKQFCGIGSVKSNIGHLEAAAGIVGLIKVLLSMKHQRLPATLHCQPPNSKIDFSHTPFYLLKENQDWRTERGSSRLAGISSFGAGGSNAHCIIESFDLPVSMQNENSTEMEEIITLSTQHESQLPQYARKMASFLSDIMNNQDRTKEHTLTNIAYTLSLRESFSHRLAIIATSLSDLHSKIVRYCRQRKPIPDIIYGKASSSEGPGENAGLKDASYLKDKRLRASLWVRGDLENIMNERCTPYQKVSLPTYPFLKERSWISEKEVLYDPSMSHTGVSHLHPLLDKNESTVKKGKFRKRVFASEYFLKDHLVAGHHVIPGVCHLEMACFGGEIYGEQKVTALKDLWLSNVISVDDNSEDIEITFEPANGHTYLVVNRALDDSGVPFSQGRLTYDNSEIIENNRKEVDFCAIKSGLDEKVEGDEFYNQFVKIGIVQKESFKVVKEFYENDSEAYSRIELPSSLLEEFHRYRLHPSLMDGAVQTAMIHLLRRLKKDVLIVPFLFGDVRILRPLKTVIHTRVLLDNLSAKQYTIHVYDESGTLLVEMKNFLLREYKEHVQYQRKPLYYVPSLYESPIPSSMNHVSSVLIFDIDNRVTDSLRQIGGFKESGLILVNPSREFRKISDRHYEIGCENPSDYKELLRHLLNRNSYPEYILFLWNFKRGEETEISAELFQERCRTGINSIFLLSKAFMSEERKTTLLYFCQGSDHAIRPDDRALTGYFRTLRLEMPLFNFKVIQCDETEDTYGDVAAIALNEFCNSNHGVDIVYRDNRRYVRRFSYGSESVLHGKESNTCLKKRGKYLITGGMGGLGQIFAKYLSKAYEAHVILVGRSPINEDKKEILRQIDALGGKSHYYQCDISNIEETTLLVRSVIDHNKELNGIFHCAGVIEDGFILKKDMATFSKVVLPKIHGLLNIDILTKSVSIDFIALFSSVSSILGNYGQGDYAFANGFLDYFAIYRESLRENNIRHGRTVVINWPYWKEGGMRLTERQEKLLKKTFGIYPLATEVGIRAFEDALKSKQTQIAVINGDLKKTDQFLETEKEIAPEPHQTVVETNKGKEDQNDDLEPRVERYFKQLFSNELKIPIDRINLGESFEDYGFDSIAMIDILTTIEKQKRFNSLPKTLFLEHKNIKSLITYFVENHAEADYSL